MRRKKQALSDRECREILERGTSGVLAVWGEDAYPYTVPLSYVFDRSKLYFHSAREGHKIDAVKNHDKASFCVIDRDDVVPEKYTTYFKSVVVFGKIRLLDEDVEKKRAMQLLATKYAPKDSDAHRDQAIDGEWGTLCVIELSIEHMTGKQAVELVNENA